MQILWETLYIRAVCKSTDQFLFEACDIKAQINLITLFSVQVNTTFEFISRN